MSMFRADRTDDTADASAWIDGELSPADRAGFDAEVQRSGQVRDTVDRIRTVSDVLSRNEPAEHEVAAAAERVRTRLDRSLRGRAAGGGVWSRQVRIPMPLVAAAAAVIVALSVAVVSLALPGESVEPYTVADLTDDTRNLNLQVHVDALESEALLQWLMAQSRLEQVTIELPQQVQFQRRGEPVLLRPGDDGEDSRLEIVPMAPIEESPR